LLYNESHDIVKSIPDLRFYLLNTGGIGSGEHYLKITLETTMGILDSLLRDKHEDWVDSPTGVKVPKAIREVDDIYLHPERLYSQGESEIKQAELNRIRDEAVEKVRPDLDPDIRRAFRGSQSQV
jgi:ATP-dependent phosphoenolpyruvate carboxykinase